VWGASHWRRRPVASFPEKNKHQAIKTLQRFRTKNY